ncbi:hypothetical protein A2625_01945 [candidate division WOR-1 bacterium RIFCSPHIGHO2_01_FULL_53_15]|uniref:Uncharacterized protein n=1 Tax=candidate division WOR-1 bacterium RIFCSPHIGHO2_01_FULL_53_15 TaxID=1802564 RepID=A0A1F4Q2A8_UNCSA|nr:MAG: hypothetical protein A2625_01945 [candidate division WOR-1 bacterium RIFCSPHIGHO2_01_FULL_53_15]OGC13589.1 MAG: hypothetical protein A3D23_06060 [candidate division WOR-1 bacterium RIFCSPHIGHO2_02_FULL_53_26]
MEENRKRLTAKRKFELYLEAKRNEANVGEVLRRYGVHLNDLRQIEAAVERAAVKALKGRYTNGSATESVSLADYGALVQELARKEKVLADLAVEYTLLKKSEFSVLKGHSKEYMFAASGGKQ